MKTFFFWICFVAFFSVNAYSQGTNRIYKGAERDLVLKYYTKAHDFTELNEIDSVIYYRKLLLNFYSSLGDTSNSIKVLTYLSDLYLKKFEVDSALEYINAGLNMIPDKEKGFRVARANLYFSLGKLYSNLGDYANSSVYIKLALNIWLAFSNAREIVGCLMELGNMEYYLGHYDSSIEYYQKALSYKFFPANVYTSGLANIYSFIGISLLEQNKIIEAEKSLLNGFKYLPISLGYLHLGKVYILEKNFASADTCLKKALEMRLEQFGKKHYLTSQCYLALGDLYKERKDYQKAFDYYSNGLISSIKCSEEAFFNPRQNRFKEIISPREFFTSLRGKAEMLIELAKKDKNNSKLTEAKRILALTIPLFSTIQKYYLLDDSKLKLRELADDIMNLGVESCYSLYTNTGDQSYVTQAFIFSESKRNSVLMESKIKREAMLTLDIPDSLKKAELKLKLKLNQIFASNEKNVTNIEGEVQSQNERLIISTYDAYDSLLTYIQKRYPKYASMVSVTNKMRLFDVKQNAGANAILEYTITRDAIFIFCITKSSVSLVKTIKKKTFNPLVENFISSIKKINSNIYENTARELYQQLISPCEKKFAGTKGLMIIPCSELASFPFEALISNNGSALLKQMSVQYLSSSNYFSKKIFVNHYPFYFMGVAPSYENNKNYSRLKNEEEVTEISELLRKNNFRNSLLIGETATKQNLNDFAGKCQILHIAAHSFADTKDEDKCGIVLGDTIFTAAEIMASEFNNDLVVLSSCEGGNGKTAGGEGVLSLARNFIRAGAKNMLVALWKVSDRHTKIFMNEFYKQLVKDDNYADALARTKRQLIKDKLFAFPNTWAAFVLMN